MRDLLGGRYEPIEVVGRGAQGEVLRARDTRHDRLVALKVCPATDAVLREARALYGCRPHAGLPLLRDDFTEGDRCVLVMDWIDGAPLQAGAPLEEVGDVLAQVAAALDHLHAHTPPLIHGDVKPANILVTASGAAVLVDLGLVGETGSGTAGYMAPEAARGEAAPAMDVYSLGATAYALLTGEPPRAGTAPRWIGLTADEATRATEALSAALALDPASRPGSASAVVAALRGAAVRRTNLPAEVTSFVGRRAEIDEVRAAMRASRVVTLTGPGGIGKTRLALRAATGIADAWFVPLAAVREDDRVAPAICDALGVADDGVASQQDALLAHLRDRTATLIVDNCEQVVDGCAAVVGALGRACPGVRVLATSREALGVDGEQVVVVPPLDVASEAATLFVSRARTQRASITFDATTEPVVLEICRRLDGLPLAIELAAANLRVAPLDELAARIDEPLDLAGPRAADARQRSLRGLIGWSWDLLDDTDRSASAALSVFAGSIGVDEGAAVCGDRAALIRLADRSLLTLHGDRYEMLETIRAFAAERLEVAGKQREARDAHLRAILALAERAAPELHGPQQARWLDRLAADHENLRAALTHAISCGDGDAALRLATAIGRYLDVRGHLREGRELLEAALAVPSGGDAVRASASRVAGVFAHRLGDLVTARQRYSAALDLARASGDDRGVADALHNLGVVAHVEGDRAGARSLWQDSLARRRAGGDHRGIADTLLELSFLASERGDLDEARTMLLECAATFEAQGDRSGVADAVSNLALLDEAAGDNVARLRRHRESLEIRRELGDRWGIAVSLANLAAATRDGGDRAAAVEAFEQAREIMRELGSRDGLAAVEAGLALAVDGRDEGVALLRSALRVRDELHDRLGVAECLEGLAALTGDGTLLAAADAIRSGDGFRRSAFEDARLAAVPRLGGPAPDVETAVRRALGAGTG